MHSKNQNISQVTRNCNYYCKKDATKLHAKQMQRQSTGRIFSERWWKRKEAVLYILIFLFLSFFHWLFFFSNLIYDTFLQHILTWNVLQSKYNFYSATDWNLVLNCSQIWIKKLTYIRKRINQLYHKLNFISREIKRNDLTNTAGIFYRLVVELIVVNASRTETSKIIMISYAINSFLIKRFKFSEW